MMGSDNLENFIFNSLAFSQCRVICGLWLFWGEGVILMLVWWLNVVLTFKLKIASILKFIFQRFGPQSFYFVFIFLWAMWYFGQDNSY